MNKKMIELLKDWRFIYKIFTFLVLFIGLILGIIYGVFIEYWYINPLEYSSISLPRTYNFNVLLSFWSVQTNIIVCVFFFYLLIYHKKEQTNKFTNINCQISITVYITVTMVLFWVLIFYGIGFNIQYNFSSKMDAAVTTIMHAITPSLALLYLFLSLGKQKFTYSNFFSKQIFLMLLYPIGYLVFINLRAKLLWDDNVKDFLFPYPFVNFYYPIFPLPIIWNNIFIILLGIIMLVSLYLLVIVINNLFYNKLIKIKKPLK